MTQRLRTLSSVPLFSGLPEATIAELSEALIARRYDKGQYVFRGGDPGHALFVIDTGRVKISAVSEEGKESILALLGPSDFFGELALLDSEPRSADALMTETGVVLALEQKVFRRTIKENPDLALVLLKALSLRLRKTDRLVHDSVFLDVPARLARFILDLNDKEGEPHDDGSVIPLRLTQSDLAAVVGSTRESVNKALGQFEKLDLIRRDGKTIIVLSPDGLKSRIY